MSFLKQNKELILASTSPVRKKILTDAGLKFKTISPNFDEEEFKQKNTNLAIKDLANLLASGKGLSVSKQYPESIIIASDQICEFENNIFDKPKNLTEASNHLNQLNGKIHYQNNAVVIALNNQIIFSHISRIELKMRKMQKEEIDHYINFDNPIGSAGSYKYESLGKYLFENVDGDYYSILGLNLQAVISFLIQNKAIEFNINN